MAAACVNNSGSQVSAMPMDCGKMVVGTGVLRPQLPSRPMASPCRPSTCPVPLTPSRATVGLVLKQFTFSLGVINDSRLVMRSSVDKAGFWKGYLYWADADSIINRHVICGFFFCESLIFLVLLCWLFGFFSW